MKHSKLQFFSRLSALSITLMLSMTMAAQTVTVQGTVTDEQGMFNLATSKQGDLLKVSSIGYETQYVTPSQNQTIVLKEETVMLGEVVRGTGVVQTETIFKVFEEKFTGRKAALIPLNKQAFLGE